MERQCYVDCVHMFRCAFGDEKHQHRRLTASIKPGRLLQPWPRFWCVPIGKTLLALKKSISAGRCYAMVHNRKSYLSNLLFLRFNHYVRYTRLPVGFSKECTIFLFLQFPVSGPISARFMCTVRIDMTRRFNSLYIEQTPLRWTSATVSTVKSCGIGNRHYM